jgi:hypothetical protein
MPAPARAGAAERRVGHEFEPSGWPTPPEYLCESPLPDPVTIARTYDAYCQGDGSALVGADRGRLFGAMVPRTLALFGIGDLHQQRPIDRPTHHGDSCGTSLAM